MPVSPEFIEALRRLDPAQTPTEEQWIDRPEEVMGRGWDLADDLRVLLEVGAPIRVLLHGAVGVGKTTELRRLIGGLEAGQDISLIIYNYTKGLSSHYDISSYINKSKSKLIIIDGLDLISFDDVFRLIESGTSLCDENLPPVIYVMPHDTMLSISREDIDSRFTKVYHLPPFPVQLPGKKQNSGAIDHMALGLKKRLQDLPVPIDDLTYRRIAYHSAGIPRHAINLLRHLILSAARKNRHLPTHLLEAERELRQDLEQALRDGDELILQRTHSAAAHTWSDASPRLIRNSVLLPYEGPERRYWCVHPLLHHLVA